MTTQLIYNGTDYEEAAASKYAEIPEWPVQDSGARWYHEAFPGQLVCFQRTDVHFGFMAEAVNKSDVPRDEDGDLNLDGLYLANNGNLYREVAV